MKNAKSSKKSTFPPLLQLSYVLQHKSEKVLEKEVGVGLAAARIMSVLDTSEVSSQRNVAMELVQTEANVSRLLQKMKTDGLVTITRNKSDSRQRDVTLTAKGNRQYLKAEKLLKKQQAQFLKLLNSGESKILAQAAEKLS
jgi:DNA-binding MarR family transcriptional regulator